MKKKMGGTHRRMECNRWSNRFPEWQPWQGKTAKNLDHKKRKRKDSMIANKGTVWARRARKKRGGGGDT